MFFNTDVEDDTNINQALEERLDLACPHCESRVYDNRIRKTDPAQPSFNERSPDFICSNDTRLHWNDSRQVKTTELLGI